MRLAVAVLSCLAAGCSGPGTIKGYPGPSRGADELAVIETGLRSQEYTIIDNQITSVDGVRFEKGAYAAEVLAGARRIGIQGLLRSRMQPRTQYCSFDLNVEARCTYRPQIPAYPRSAYDQPRDAEWRVTRNMTVVGECADTSYAVEVPIDCSSRP